jgi:hypothetical protein
MKNGGTDGVVASGRASQQVSVHGPITAVAKLNLVRARKWLVLLADALAV